RVGVVECPQCGLAITAQRPRPEDINSLYDEHYYAHTLNRPTRKTRARDKLRTYKGGYPVKPPWLKRFLCTTVTRFLRNLFLFYLASPGAAKRLPEIRVGTGDALLWAQANGWAGHGVELDAPAVQHARTRGIHDVRCGTVEGCNYPNGYFDAILMLQVL